MKSARTACLAIALLLVAAMPVSAGAKDRDTQPAVEREVRYLSFENHGAAERFFDALSLVITSRGQAPQLDVTLAGHNVQIAGPPKLMRHVAALLGTGDGPQSPKKSRRSKAKKPHRDVDEAAELSRQMLTEVGEDRPERRARRQRTRGSDHSPELEVRVFALEFADAPHLVKFVDMLREGRKALWVVECDERTNSIVVKGPPRLIAEAEQLIRVTRESLFKGIAQARPGQRVLDISAAIQRHAEAHGYSPVRKLVGHGVGREMHEPPHIANFIDRDPDESPELVPGMTLAIEPMVNAGTWQVVQDRDGWTYRTKDRSLSAHFEHTVAVTEQGNEILTLRHAPGGGEVPDRRQDRADRSLGVASEGETHESAIIG